jgi:hypothetical protein
MSTDFTATRWDGALRAVYLVRLLAKGTPQSVARGVPRSGDRAAAGMPDRAKVYMGRLHPAMGSHLPSEDTASPFAVVPFASSPFAHPIPQSRRRASEDLFRDS